MAMAKLDFGRRSNWLGRQSASGLRCLWRCRQPCFSPCTRMVAMESADPHNLQRFIDVKHPIYGQVRAELLC
jgi:hypothetical protein